MSYLRARTAYVPDRLYTQIKLRTSSRGGCREFCSNFYGEYQWSDVCDVMLWANYKGWDSGTVSDAVSEEYKLNTNMVMPLGIHRYSYGANPEHHTAWSSAANGKPATPTAFDSFHYEEYQAYACEQYLNGFSGKSWPLFQLYGTMFDYADAVKSEGGTPD